VFIFAEQLQYSLLRSISDNRAVKAFGSPTESNQVSAAQVPNCQAPEQQVSVE
jgi:hypothetical protein